jgi:hypothetical protein
MPDGISDSEYDQLFSNDIARYLPFLQGDLSEQEEERSTAILADPNLQSMNSRFVLLCRFPDCSDEHMYAAPGFYNTMPWDVRSDELFYVYIPARVSFQYFCYNLEVKRSKRCRDLRRGIKYQLNIRITD